jgi:hypothetical protein
MSKTTQLRGICASCKFGPECPLHHGAAVMQCGQFAACDYAPAHFSHSVAPAREVTDMGLCTRCDAEVECTLVRPEGGVWRCEGFRP